MIFLGPRQGRCTRRRRRRTSTWVVTAVVVLVLGGGAEGEPVRYFGHMAELTVSEPAEGVLRVVVAPIDEQTGEPMAPAESAAPAEPAPAPTVRLRELDGPQQFDVGALRIEIEAEPLRMTIRNAAGDTVQVLTFDETDGSMRFNTDAPVLGMGEGAHQFDRRGAEYSMRDGWGAWERPTHGSWIAAPYLIGTDGWALLVLNPFGAFDLRQSPATFTPTHRDEQATGDLPPAPLEVYVLAWDTPAELMRMSARLFGATPMPPRWAMGYMQSHRTLAGPDEVIDIARTFREKQLPCDALIYLGTGYCPAGWNTGHGSVDFNPQTFDQPAAMLEALRDMHFNIVLHVNAPPLRLTGDAVEPVEDAAPVQPRQRRADISPYWAMHRETFALGVAGWWPDDGDELDRESRIARHLMYDRGPLLDRPNVRPWSLHRTTYPGAQRYGGWVWSGDVDSRWDTLATQVRVGQNHALSLSPYWGTDIGGFFPTPQLDGELYVRWFQFGAFCPLFRAHGRTWRLRLPWGWSTGEPGPIEQDNWRPPRDILHDERVEPICKRYLELRYRLLPYNYTLCREAHDEGLPPMRAMWLHYPDDAEAVVRGDQYLWGRDILVAPVTQRGAVQRAVYLPAGDWCDFWTNEVHEGGREITRGVDLATLPLFVRAGAIIPMDPVRQYAAQPVDEPTTIRIYTGADGMFRWYEDDGVSLDYLDGEYNWTRLMWDDTARRLIIEREEHPGAPAPSARTFIIELMPEGVTRQVEYDGERLELDL